MTQKPQNKPFKQKSFPGRPLTDKEALIVPQLERAQVAVAELIPLFPDQTIDDAELALVIVAAQSLDLLQRLVHGSEPFWMQDIRLAQRRLDAARVASRNQRPDHSNSASEGLE